MKIYWHVAFLNHWLEVVLEQLKMIIESGLYEETSVINVGCVGDIDERDILKDLFKEFSKINIRYYGNSTSVYEFPTLKILQDDCNGDNFYGLYIQTKGVSWGKDINVQAYIGGTKWRMYMGYWNVTRWKDCVKNLDLGYELCGVKLLSPRHSPSKKEHYSGNVWWFRSEYIKTLPKIETLNHSDRYEAEMWVCSNSPIAATLCQDFIDYNSKGVFIAPK